VGTRIPKIHRISSAELWKVVSSMEGEFSFRELAAFFPLAKTTAIGGNLTRLCQEGRIERTGRRERMENTKVVLYYRVVDRGEAPGETEADFLDEPSVELPDAERVWPALMNGHRFEDFIPSREIGRPFRPVNLRSPFLP